MTSKTSLATPNRGDKPNATSTSRTESRRNALRLLCLGGAAALVAPALLISDEANAGRAGKGMGEAAGDASPGHGMNSEYGSETNGEYGKRGKKGPPWQEARRTQ